MKKKIVLSVITIAAALTLSACGNTEEETVNDPVVDSVIEEENEFAESTDDAMEEEPYFFARWDATDWEPLLPLFDGLGDMAFVTGTAERIDVHIAVTYDEDIINGIVFNTTVVDFNTPGEYEEIYTVHFDREALKAWMEENDIDPAEYEGMDADAEQVFVPYTATITISDDEAVVAEITETASIAGAVKNDEDNDAVYASAEPTGTQSADAGGTDVASNSENSSGNASSGNSPMAGGSTNSGSSGTASNNSSSSGSSGNSGSSSGSSSGNNSSASSGSSSSGSGGSTASTSCDHNWVATYHEATGHYEQVLVQAAYDTQEKVGSQYVCNGCGFATQNGEEIAGHTALEGCGSHAEYIYKDVHHDAVYDTKWVQDSAAYTTYTCSKCGATK